MPRQQPRQSYHHLRNYTEKFSWQDPRTQQTCTGFNPPPDALFVERVPFTVRYITRDGKVESGRCVCIKVDAARRQRKLMFVESQQIRRVRDYLIIEVDGVRFVSH